MRSKRILVLIAVLLAIAGVFALKTNDQKQKTEDQQPAAQITTSETPQKEVAYQGEEGVNALELLKQKHQVETRNFEGIGELVTSIDGVTADDKHFWAFYVNGQQSQVGAGTYVTKPTDAITWKLEEIQ